MLEMLKERKAALEAQGKKGFTLMEMLIVIAIIAILIAIAIPVFTTQLHKAELATDVANTRSAYSEAVTTAMAKSESATDKYDANGKLLVSFTDVCQHGSASVSGTTVTVEHSSSFDGNSESFTIDEDVALTINPSS